ncbi:hypothetical protein [Rhizobium oryziradicis]|uniref:hypothetical protein n=1 Tax=Rhizobium oryziradicis TaxID=1867956 RepID=UPI0011151BDB|nr:hypothetical protein [Rhizobium oryziradicis]
MMPQPTWPIFCRAAKVCQGKVESGFPKKTNSKNQINWGMPLFQKRAAFLISYPIQDVCVLNGVICMRFGHILDIDLAKTDFTDPLPL